MQGLLQYNLTIRGVHLFSPALAPFLCHDVLVALPTPFEAHASYHWNIGLAARKIGTTTSPGLQGYRATGRTKGTSQTGLGQVLLPSTASLHLAAWGGPGGCCAHLGASAACCSGTGCVR